MVRRLFPPDVVNLVAGDRPQPAAEGLAILPSAELANSGGDGEEHFLPDVGRVGVVEVGPAAPAEHYRLVQLRQPPPGRLVPGPRPFEQAEGGRHVQSTTRYNGRVFHKSFLPGAS